MEYWWTFVIFIRRLSPEELFVIKPETMMVMAEAPSRPTTTTTTTTTSSAALLGEFRLLAENGKESEEKAAAAAAPPNDALFYKGIPDVERVFDFDYGLLYKNYVNSRTLMISAFSFQLYHLSGLSYVDLYHRDDDYPSAVTIVVWVVLSLLQYSLMIMILGGVVYLSLTFQHGWQSIAGQHVALTSTGIRFDRTFPAPETVSVRCFSSSFARIALLVPPGSRVLFTIVPEYTNNNNKSRSRTVKSRASR
jgi:hypothetical protein